MSRLRATLSEKSSWTPKNYLPSNEKIFEERMTLIKKWYRGWSEAQRWCLLEYILQQLSDEQLLLIHGLLDPSLPAPDQDFTRVLPRCLCLKIFSLLDPQSLCRAAQVCWYWRYLTECNEIWREKCLRLGWFLPSPPPPQMRDHTLWKRHYVACVCQLHWNPPQPPDDEDDGGADSADGLHTEEEQKERRVRKKRTATSHMVGEAARQPWRDPDPHPMETHYDYKESPYIPLYSRFPYLRVQQSTNPTVTRPIQTPPPPTFVPPPTSLLHPTLLEKMRLGSPTTAHMDLSTLNRYQTESEINETFYELQKTSPFPKLPAYFVHQSTPGSSVDRGGLETISPGGIQKAPRLGGRVTTPGGVVSRSKSHTTVPTANQSNSDTPLVPTALDSSSRSSVRVRVGSTGSVGEVEGSWRQGSESATQGRGGKGRPGVRVARKEEELPTRAWHIPEDEDI